MRRCKSRLLHMCEIIIRILIQFQHTYIYQRKIAMRPYFSQVKRVPPIGFGLLFAHHLDFDSPLRKLAVINMSQQVMLRKIRIDTAHGSSFFISKVFDALFGFKMEFYPSTLIFSIDHRESMATKP